MSSSACQDHGSADADPACPVSEPHQTATPTAGLCGVCLLTHCSSDCNEGALLQGAAEGLYQAAASCCMLFHLKDKQLIGQVLPSLWTHNDIVLQQGWCVSAEC